MRQKRAKAYRKLLYLYRNTFGFREPYQVLVDASIIQCAHDFKMDLSAALERTLQGKIKPMITQCSITQLYQSKAKQQIETAKKYERRRCNHFGDPKPEEECLRGCVGSSNHHRYIVATNDADLRARLRSIPGMPLIYIKRSVMVLEPPSPETLQAKSSGEKKKLGVSKEELDILENRKRGLPDSEDAGHLDLLHNDPDNGTDQQPLSKKRKGPKGPNPLSVKRPKQQEPSIRAREDTVRKKHRRKHNRSLNPTETIS